MHSLLEPFRTVAFAVRLGVCGTAGGLYRALAATPEVRTLRQALSNNVLPIYTVSWRRTMERVEQEVHEHFEAGQVYQDDLLLAACCVAFEPVEGRLAEEVILSVAGLHVMELPLAPPVAAIAWRARHGFAVDTPIPRRPPDFPLWGRTRKLR